MRFVFASIFIFCLFSFKFNIVGEVRVDDVLVVFLCFFSFVVFSFDRRLKVSGLLTAPVLLFFLFLIANFFSLFYNYLNGRVGFFYGFLFSIRHFEYFLFIFLGYILSYYNFNFKLCFYCYLLYIVALIPLQSYGVVPVFSGFTPDRAIANTGGPWELAVVAAFMVIFFYEYELLYFSFFAFVVLLFTESRVTFVATMFALFVNFDRGSSFARKIGFYIPVILLVVPVVGLAFVFSDDVSSLFSERNVFDRIVSFFSYETFYSVSSAWAGASEVFSSKEFAALNIQDKLSGSVALEGDVSAIVRFVNWAILIKSTVLSVDSFLIGLGPSFAGKAVDGGYVRVFVEVGFVGFAIFVSFLCSLLFGVRSRLVFYYLIILSLSAVFIDIFTTYKAMFLFWVFYGDYLYRLSNGEYRAPCLV